MDRPDNLRGDRRPLTGEVCKASAETKAVACPPSTVEVILGGMLPATIRYKLLFGQYRTPRFKVGAIAKDELRGDVKIVGVSDARIP